ncbi:MAG: protein jag [Clostridiales bacterium]|nr:protein jag [Clostridiales bacterium]
MSNWQEFSAKTVDEALTEALIKLETTSDQIEYEVIEKESSGLLGLFSKPARIRVCKKEDVQDIVRDFLNRLFENMNLNVEVEMNFDEEEKIIYVELKGDEMGVLIGKRGQTLDSIQYLTSLVANKNRDEYIKIKMDTENYRERRKETIENLAKNIAIKVKKTRRPATLEPMNPYERRLIHAALQDDKYVETYSEGEEPFRKVIVNISKEYASMPPRHNNNYRKKNGYNGRGGRKPYNKSYGKKPYGKSSYNKNNNRNSYHNQSNFGADVEESSNNSTEE